jgi:hypothetical protein
VGNKNMIENPVRNSKQIWLSLWDKIVSVAKSVQVMFYNESKPENMIDSNYAPALVLNFFTMTGV